MGASASHAERRLDMNGYDASFVRSIRGPVTLMTVGILFALNNFTPYRFEQTWPVLLIVFGLLSLLRRGAAQRTPEAAAGVPPYAYPPPSGYQGGYRQSQYTGTAAPAQPQEPPKDPTDSGATPPQGGQA